jgi:TRAP-type mannitol/chloroaromatic compound transport system permease large subunit
VAPPEITIRHMYRGVVPFIALQCVTLVLVISFPRLVTWLPSVMLQFR